MQPIAPATGEGRKPVLSVQEQPQSQPGAGMTPAQARSLMAQGQITGPTTDLCPGHAQANLVILPKDWAFDFLLFCLRNPRPCPLMEVLEPGVPFTAKLAKAADVRRELPRYRIWEKGKLVAEPTSIEDWWRDDLVSFFLGCSFSFDTALQQAGIGVRHIEEGRNVPMYLTQVPNQRAGRLQGNLVVSMRPMPPEQVPLSHEVSGRYEGAHGAPVHDGPPEQLGIKDLARPEFGDAVTLRPGEVPVFWACGVTPQAAVMEAAPELAITHAPGHMFVCDIMADEIGSLSGP